MKERTLPANIEAEQAVIGAALVHGSGYELASRVLGAQDFYREAHRRIWQAVAALADAKVEVDFVTLKNELGRRGDLEECGGPVYLASLTDGVPRGTNVPYYAGIVKEKSVLRAIIVECEQVSAAAYAGREAAAAVVAKADAAFLGLQQAVATESVLVDVRASPKRIFADLEARMASKGALRGLTTGFASLDELTLGWRPGNLIIVAGKTSMGKSIFGLSTAVAMAKSGARGGYFSYEMSRAELEDRLLSAESQVDHLKIQSGYVSESECKRLGEALEVIGGLPMSISDCRTLTVGRARAEARRLRADGGLGWLVFDYAQSMPPSTTRKGATRTEEIADNARRLQSLAGELQVPIILLSQVKRGEGEPQLDWLRDCGDLEEAAHEVGIIHRKDAKTSGTTKFVLAKQRNGPTGAVNLTINRETVSLRDGGEPEPEPVVAQRPRRQRTFGSRSRNWEVS